MDSVFGSPRLMRKPLRINGGNKRSFKFVYNRNLRYKASAAPKIVTWAHSGKGVQGESVNSKSQSIFIINRNWRPI